MNIQIIETSSSISEFGMYETTCFDAEKVKVTITKFTSTGRSKSYINVTVHNAMQRAYKGFGKQFPDVDKALEHYSNKKIQAILNTYK